MKNFILLTFVLLSSVAFAKPKNQTPECQAEVVAAVNKHHKLAEGAVYAIRTLYVGQFASAFLVGHSDETDPTDYLVTVEHKGCKMKSIVWTNESSNVEEYTDDETVND